MDTADARGSRRRVWIVVAVAAVAAGALALGMALAPTPAPSRFASGELIERPTPSPTPTPTGFPENVDAYDLETLPIVDVFSVNHAFDVDDDPFGETEGIVATPIAEGAAVFADPRQEPVAYLPHEQHFEGTIVPVIEKQDHWVKVLLVGRSGLPPEANPSQTVGWMRTADVTLSPNTAYIAVDLSDRTIDIVREGSSERVATDFAFGAADTPTPLGRSFIMMTRTTSDAYTRGHPVVYLSVQSPTLAEFGGSAAAVTAFHDHDHRSGTISNGCVRVDAAVIVKLAELPPGTPVYIAE